jgi:dTMP kinase
MAPLIAIEGIDGVGKATQTKLLAERLEREGLPVRTYAFPAYKESFFGSLLGDCLAGKCGDFVNADPHLASLPYMLDRQEAATEIRESLLTTVVICDRYSGSNQIHQGGKFSSDADRTAFLDWLYEAEHRVIGNPAPDLVVYLDAPVDVSLSLLAQKRAAKSQHLTEGDLDQVERDLQYLENSHVMARWIAARDKQWRLVDCTDGQGHMRSREDIHAEVMRFVGEVIEFS